MSLIERDLTAMEELGLKIKDRKVYASFRNSLHGFFENYQFTDNTPFTVFEQVLIILAVRGYRNHEIKEVTKKTGTDQDVKNSFTEIYHKTACVTGSDRVCRANLFDILHTHNLLAKDIYRVEDTY